MNKKAIFAVSLIIIIIIASGVVWFVVQNEEHASTELMQYSYRIINTYPHDTSAFTEGLIYDNGSLYESTGETSSLRRVDLQSGMVTQEYLLSTEYFGEGLAAVNGSLVQLTWQKNIGFIYDEQTFKLKGNFSISSEGWGLTYDGNKLIMSNGSSTLQFLDPTSYSIVGYVNVSDGDKAVTNINELEYINGDVYANIWKTTQVAIINPLNGHVKGWIDLSGLYQPQGLDDVLNGIAYDQQNGRLFVTGKNWPSLYQIELVHRT